MRLCEPQTRIKSLSMTWSPGRSSTTFRCPMTSPSRVCFHRFGVSAQTNPNASAGFLSLVLVCQRRRTHGEAKTALISTHKVMIDNGPCFRKRLLLCGSRDAIRLCSQQPRARRDMHAPTWSILDGVQAVSSVLKMICVRFWPPGTKQTLRKRRPARVAGPLAGPS